MVFSFDSIKQFFNSCPSGSTVTIEFDIEGLQGTWNGIFEGFDIDEIALFIQLQSAGEPEIILPGVTRIPLDRIISAALSEEPSEA